VMITYIAIPWVFEVCDLTKGKRDGSNPFNLERSAIGGYRDARGRRGRGTRQELV
jgi:hypothetical protein